ncbi:MAG TPA: gliding motility-associated ABC transporter permease subunit GldF [Bacteroidales bacterium]|nr:gliding motility-associated ABC transporter permease subunit GldF [Bacteroidales bacterium]
MFSLFKKELSLFYSTLTGYVAISVFLLTTSLFLWVFPGAFNIIDSGAATLAPFFELAPWIFLFLVPAITMRMFAEEQKSGTIELLFTRPLTDLQIILAKYFAAIILVLTALAPTLFYLVSVYIMGNGTVDLAAATGSYIGLFFLAAVYASIGLFASALTDNQIASFMAGVFVAMLFFTGFDFLAEMAVFKEFSEKILWFGISEHYNSLSRGVIDSRDVLYFLSLITVFLSATAGILTYRKS